MPGFPRAELGTGARDRRNPMKKPLAVLLAITLGWMLLFRKLKRAE